MRATVDAEGFFRFNFFLVATLGVKRSERRCATRGATTRSGHGASGPARAVRRRAQVRAPRDGGEVEAGDGVQGERRLFARIFETGKPGALCYLRHEFNKGPA